MHSEHLQNVSFVWVVLGWFVAVAATSIGVVALAAAGIMDTDGTPAVWAVLCVAIGFWIGGYMTGTRDIEAPILHGIGIGLTSLLAWFLLNVVVALSAAEGQWVSLSPVTTAALLLLQMVAAVAGAWVADRRALRGQSLTGD